MLAAGCWEWVGDSLKEDEFLEVETDLQRTDNCFSTIYWIRSSHLFCVTFGAGDDTSSALYSYRCYFGLHFHLIVPRSPISSSNCLITDSIARTSHHKLSGREQSGVICWLGINFKPYENFHLCPVVFDFQSMKAFVRWTDRGTQSFTLKHFRFFSIPCSYRLSVSSRSCSRSTTHPMFPFATFSALTTLALLLGRYRELSYHTMFVTCFFFRLETPSSLSRWENPMKREEKQSVQYPMFDRVKSVQNSSNGRVFPWASIQDCLESQLYQSPQARKQYIFWSLNSAALLIHFVVCAFRLDSHSLPLRDSEDVSFRFMVPFEIIHADISYLFPGHNLLPILRMNAISPRTKSLKIPMACSDSEEQ